MVFREPGGLGVWFDLCLLFKGGVWGELTHVTSSETKKRSATFVYPNAAPFASMAALLFRGAMVDCALGVMGGGTADLGLIGVEPTVTEYWSYPLSSMPGFFLSGIMKTLAVLGDWSVANSLVMWISVVLKPGFSIRTGTVRDGLRKARSRFRLAKISRPARTYIQNEIKIQHLVFY